MQLLLKSSAHSFHHNYGAGLSGGVRLPGTQLGVGRETEGSFSDTATVLLGGGTHVRQVRAEGRAPVHSVTAARTKFGIPEGTCPLRACFWECV